MEIKNIKRLCYELYKVDWKRSHMITAEREMDTIKDYFEGLVSSEAEYPYAAYLCEFGYDGEFYACFQEFCDTEYLNADYMHSLLEDPKLITLYNEDISSATNSADASDNTQKDTCYFDICEEDINICPLCCAELELGDEKDNGYGKRYLYWTCKFCGNTGKAIIDTHKDNTFVRHEVD